MATDLICSQPAPTGLLAARTASVATGEAESSTGVRLESLFKAGTSRPILEALSTYAQDLENIECDLLPSQCLNAA
jgi:hypothetical protein